LTAVLPQDPDDPDKEETEITAVGPVSAGPASVRDRAYLIVLTGMNVGKMYRLDDSEEIIVGRSSAAQVRIDDDLVSRKHARIRRMNRELVLEDLKSANGIAVNGARVQKHSLKDGDKIQIGNTTILKFTYTDQLDESFQKQMYDAALRDGLTGVFNRAFFVQRIEAEYAYAKRHKTNLALLIVDIDHFKSVNDTCGHPVGDTVLKAVAQGMLRTVRVEDVLARYGGEEFCVICRGIELKNASVLAERIRKSTAELRFEGGKPPTVTVSVGVAAFPENKVENSAQLIAMADEALFRAKRAGRNRVVTA
jgi:diguanylate cyclase (GGDEF)-like protein